MDSRQSFPGGPSGRRRRRHRDGAASWPIPYPRPARQRRLCPEEPIVKMWIMKPFSRPAPGSMTCRHVGEVLQEYLDGHIDDERAVLQNILRSVVGAAWRPRRTSGSRRRLRRSELTCQPILSTVFATSVNGWQAARRHPPDDDGGARRWSWRWSSCIPGGHNAAT